MNGLSSLKSQAFVPGELMIRTREAATLQGAQSLSEKYGAQILDAYEFPTTSLDHAGQLLHLQLPQGLTTQEAIRRMASDPTIEFAEPNYVYTLEKDEVASPQPQSKAVDGQPGQLIPNDLDRRLWGLHNTGQNMGKEDSDIDAPEAWNIHVGRTDAPIIAVIDTGVDYNHPDLKSNMWINSGEVPGDGIDNDGNGVIDDVHGFDANGQNGNPYDGHGHGSHCAGTIGAVGNNELGVVGVNHQAQIMAVKIFDDAGSTNSAAIVRGIEYATKMGARITSNSWGGGAASEAIKQAFIASPALHIMAAGNNGSDNDKRPHYPSSYEIDNNIAVAASDRNDRKAGFSNYGKTSVDIAAPGKDIFSLEPGGGYTSKSGTSMATPHVSGVAGLVASLYPQATNEEIKLRLLQGADKVEGWEQYVASGARLNAHGALTVTPVPPAPPASSLSSAV